MVRFNPADIGADFTINTGSGKCLDATGAGSANGTRLRIWSCGSGANQLWSPLG